MNDILRGFIAENEDDNAAAFAFLESLHVRKSAVEVLMPIVVNAVADVRRVETHATERSVFGAGSARRTLGEVLDSVADRKRLLDEKFWLGDGRSVMWGDATVEDHRARIALLEKQVVGLSDTIDRHRQAIVEIEANAVTSLNEIASGEEAA